MHQGTRKNDNVKSIMKSKQAKKENHNDGSTGDVEEDSFADDSSASSSRSREEDEDSKSNSTPSAPTKKPNVLQIAGRETAYVLCSKTMAYLVLLLSSIACGVVTFYFIEEEEEESFRNDVREEYDCG